MFNNFDAKSWAESPWGLYLLLTYMLRALGKLKGHAHLQILTWSRHRRGLRREAWEKIAQELGNMLLINNYSLGVAVHVPSDDMLHQVRTSFANVLEDLDKLFYIIIIVCNYHKFQNGNEILE